MKTWQQFIKENIKIPGTLKRANDIKDRINLIRTNDFHFWREDDEVLDLMDELDSIDYYYDEDAMDVKEK